ncbi:hypothetical protein ASD16_08905 [Cellulomonas sp. Root485]|uniref:hypothetical protein n=1 Tax=Cellulomonas sp. Root485 TaxID=1736546 RepID=UPI000700C5B4|nr:hypothetical protein [Cellulomonas sp. Root485]KQY22739.1 hypothetical protein ASD16_08905 [Cellulomonas sp. Root485]
MTRDLHDYMSDALAQSTRALADTADDSNRVSRLRGAVRRRRTTRAAVRSTSVACVAVAVGALGWLVAPRHEPLPAQTPSPSVSATSTPTPTPTVDPVTVVLPGLPPMPEATPELLARTTPGWVLFRFAGPAPVTTDAGPENEALEALPKFNALVLASPEGERYRVVDLATDALLSVDRWVAGSTTADVTVWGADGGWSWGTVDLLTGDVTAIPTVPSASTVGWTRTGERVVLAGVLEDPPQRTVIVVDRSGKTRTVGAGAGVRDAWKVAVDPSGARVLIQDRTSPESAVVVDLATDESTAVRGWPSFPECTAVSWIDDDDVLVQCLVEDARPSHWRVDTSPTGADPVPVLVEPDDPSTDVYPAHEGIPTGDGGTAFVGTGPGASGGYCGGSVYVWRSSSDTVELLATNDDDLMSLLPEAGADGDVYLTRMPVCADLGMPEISRVDGTTGATTILSPVDWGVTGTGSADSFTVGR